MNLIYTLFLLAGGFVLLVYGAGFLVDNASSLAARLGIPNIVIGLTIVAFGTSSPELLVSIMASVNGSSELALGNVVGSNIFNILFILGITAAISPLAVKSGTTWIEIPLTLLSAIVILVLANDIILNGESGSVVSKGDGIILLLFFTIFMAYNLIVMKRGDKSDVVAVSQKPLWKSILVIMVGLTMLIAGGRAIVWSASEIAVLAGIPERIIGLTIVSIGTSLPEAATSIIAARRKNSDIAIGNIVGSNIFNMFLVLGVSSVISPVAVNVRTNIDLLVNMAASLLLFIFIFTGKGRSIGRVEGVLFTILFISYIVFLLLFP
jgi:cation:H+ antiporter